MIGGIFFGQFRFIVLLYFSYISKAIKVIMLKKMFLVKHLTRNIKYYFRVKYSTKKEMNKLVDSNRNPRIRKIYVSQRLYTNLDFTGKSANDL